MARGVISDADVEEQLREKARDILCVCVCVCGSHRCRQADKEPLLRVCVGEVVIV